ncbi:MAG TPA: pyridoxal phosphate-dependent aminotransferase [Candidatus Acidoferrales bacterium]|jgi:aspartate/methionine/tyrosine aminotransferase|nr:pyridoxal phosphate-dependent aminotransferase [Candidatus Acidoferrales bacterium]
MFSDRTNWNLAHNRLSETLARTQAQGSSFLDLTTSNPTECGLRYNSEAILRSLQNPAVLTYRPDPKGLPGARAAVAQYYRSHGIEVSAEDIILTTSTSEAYSFVFRLLCNPGDELLVPAPSYPLFEYLADIQDVKLSPYSLVYDHGWQIDLHALERALTARTRGLVVVHPNNPTGHFVKNAERGALNEICTSRGIALIADEVFLDFPLEPQSATSFAGETRALTFTLTGISKICGLPQMKMAWLAVSGPEQVKTQALERLEIIADTYLSMNTPVQLALPAFLDQRTDFHRQLMERVRSNLSELDRQLSLQNSMNRLRVEGGWYAVLRVPATRSDEELAISLLETKGVYVHPGHFYNFPGDGYVVLSLITPEQDFSEGVNRLISVV